MLPVGLLLHAILIPFSILALTSPPFKGRAIFVTTIIVYLLYQAERNPFTSDPNIRFSSGILWYLYLGTVEKLVSGVPEKAYWHLGRPREEAASFPAFGWEKIKWATALCMNMRGIGWNFQVKGVPLGRKDETRGAFLMRQFRELTAGFVVLDACSWFLARCRYPPDIDESLMSASNLSTGKWLVIIFIMCLQSYLGNKFLYWVLSVFAVATGISDPQEWPPLFGLLSEVRTLRFFWGEFWHQTIRKILSGYAHILLRILWLPRYSIISSYVSLVFTFTMSGLYHGYESYALSYPTALSRHATIYDRFGRFLVFFVIQPVGIIMEDLVVRLYRKFASEPQNSAARRILPWQSFIGYVWVASWMAFSGSILVDNYLKTEMGLLGSKTSITESTLAALGEWLPRG